MPNEPTTTQKGYGAHHQAVRARWAPLVDRGEVVCGKCGRYIQPGTPWDLSHPLDDKTQRPVPWHRACNRRYAASVTKPRRRAGASERPDRERPPGWRSPHGQPWSRDWGDGHWGEE